jgi:hypothetical protein
MLCMHLGFHGRNCLPRRGEGLVERGAGLREGVLALLQFCFLLGEGTALELELAPDGFSLLDLHLFGVAASGVPELLRRLHDRQGKLLCFASRQAIGEAAAPAVQALA